MACRLVSLARSAWSCFSWRVTRGVAPAVMQAWYAVVTCCSSVVSSSVVGCLSWGRKGRSPASASQRRPQLLRANVPVSVSAAVAVARRKFRRVGAVLCEWIAWSDTCTIMASR